MKLLYSAFDVVPAPKGASVRIQETLKALAVDFEVQAFLLGEPGYLSSEEHLGVQVERLIAPEPPFLEKTVLFGSRYRTFRRFRYIFPVKNTHLVTTKIYILNLTSFFFLCRKWYIFYENWCVLLLLYLSQLTSITTKQTKQNNGSSIGSR